MSIGNEEYRQDLETIRQSNPIKVRFMYIFINSPIPHVLAAFKFFAIH